MENKNVWSVVAINAFPETERYYKLCLEMENHHFTFSLFDIDWLSQDFSSNVICHLSNIMLKVFYSVQLFIEIPENNSSGHHV